MNKEQRAETNLENCRKETELLLAKPSALCAMVQSLCFGSCFMMSEDPVLENGRLAREQKGTSASLRLEFLYFW